MTKAERKEILVDQIKTAKYAANTAVKYNPEDGGTCNLDSAMVKREKWVTYDETIAMFKECGLYAYTGSGWNKGWIIIGSPCGQGNARTRWAEAFAKSLKRQGFETSMYYQID